MKVLRCLIAVLVAATCLAGLGAGPAAQAAPGCTLNSPGGTVVRTVGSRTYRLHVPANLIGTDQVPLVLALHGAWSNSEVTESYIGWNSVAAKHKFIIAYPDGLPAGNGYWNAGPGSPDVSYMRQVVADVAATWCVDPQRIHAMGLSRGGVMSLRLACDAADLFASVASVIGSDPTFIDGGGPCNPSRPIGVGIFAGVLDPIANVLININARDLWVARNRCPTTPRSELVLLQAETYGPCAAGVQVVWRLYLQSHNWPIGSDANDIVTRMLGLFAANPLP